MQEQRSAPLPEKILSVSAILGESWQLVRGLKWPVFWLGIAVNAMILVNITLTFFANSTLIPSFMMAPGPRLELLRDMLIFSLTFIPHTISLYLTTMLIMLGVRQAIGLPVKVDLVFQECMRVKGNLLILMIYFLALKFVFISLVPSALPFLRIGFGGGFDFQIILSLAFLFFLWAMLIFSIPLLVTKKCSAIHALKLGLKMINKYGLKVLLCMFMMSLIYLLSVLTFGILFIWTVPMTYAMNGVWFREAFGVSKKINV